MNSLRKNIVKKCLSQKIIKQYNQFQRQNPDLVQNFEKVPSYPERIAMITKMAFNAYLYPQNGTYLSELGCLSSDHSLIQIREKMQNDPEGQLILENMPRVNSNTVNIDDLLKLDNQSFGYAYGYFMKSHGFSSNDRPKSKYIQDAELCYIYQRYKEIHDFIHVINGYDTTPRDEIIIKWFEMIQLGLPSAALSSLVAPLKLSSTQNCDMFNNHIPQIIQNGNNCRFVMNIYFENYFEMSLKDFRQKIGIKPNQHRNMM